MKSKVYFTREITPEAVVKLYRAVGIQLPGKVAVKVHSGEKGNQNFLRPEFWKPMVDKIKGTIVECNTAYQGSRTETQMHYQVAEDHGYTEIADVVIMDEDGASLVNRMESRNAEHVLEHGEEAGLGNRSYELVSIDE